MTSEFSEHDRLFDANKRLEYSNKRLENSSTLLTDIERGETSILVELDKQKETIIKSRKKLEKVDEHLDDSNSVPKKMGRNFLNPRYWFG